VSSGPVASLTRFVAFIEKLQQSQTQWSGEEPLGQASQAVRIMSVHKSKGLEFPVVFVAELDASFKKSHGDTQILIDSDCIGLQITSPRDNSKFDSAAHQVIKQRQCDVSLAEEMRILYVALTRPINKLILVA